jgi:hypothetical protein
MTMTSNCILRILTKDDLAHIKTRLRELKEWAWHPLFLPAILVEMRIRSFPNHMTEIRRFLYGVEKTTGTHKNHIRKMRQPDWKGRSLDEMWADPEFETAPAELTSLASQCAYYENACQSALDHASWLQTRQQRFGSNPTDARWRRAGKMLESKLDFMKTSVVDMQSRSTYLGKRAEVQMQIVSGTSNCLLSPFQALSNARLAVGESEQTLNL